MLSPAPSRTAISPSAPPGVLEIRLMGGFRVQRGGDPPLSAAWHRRTAKTLVKLLATHPRHAVHRDHVLELLWPETDPGSALNSFGKSLHAARRALEPDLTPRRSSAYLHLVDSMVMLDLEQVVVDANRFEQLAQLALRAEDGDGFEAALAVYGGELLPEDRYEDWCEPRRGELADLHVRLLIRSSAELAQRGALNEAADRLREALQDDPTREDVHRQLMRLYADMGTPDQAVRQFHVCEEVLRRQLELSPQAETIALHQDLLASRRRASQPPDRPSGPSAPQLSRPDRRSAASSIPTPAAAADRSRAGKTTGDPAAPRRRTFVGREAALDLMLNQLSRGARSSPGAVMIRGEAGIGKTRLLQEFADRARARGATVLWGGAGAHAHGFVESPLAVALEAYVASRPDAEREQLARSYPPLCRLLPSLLPTAPAPASRDSVQWGLGDGGIGPAIARMLTDLSRTQPVVLALGDLHDAGFVSLDLLRYLLHLAPDRSWLILATVRADAVDDLDWDQWLSSSVRDGLSTVIDLDCLSRPASDELFCELAGTGHIDQGLLELVYTIARGNPRYVVALAEEVRRVGGSALALAQSSPHDDPVSPALRAQTSIQLATLARGARRVLELVSVTASPEVSLRELRAAASSLSPPISEASLFDALDEALSARVLEERADGYAFRYPLVRRTLAGGLSQHRRTQFREALGLQGT